VELQSRQFNPTWVREMQKSGYAPAHARSRKKSNISTDFKRPGRITSPLNVADRLGCIRQGQV